MDNIRRISRTIRLFLCIYTPELYGRKPYDVGDQPNCVRTAASQYCPEQKCTHIFDTCGYNKKHTNIIFEYLCALLSVDQSERIARKGG